VGQRIAPDGSVAWRGFLGVGDDVLEPLPAESLRRLREITRGQAEGGTVEQRGGFADWMADAIDPRNVAGLADPSRHNLYPVDLDVLVERHALVGLSQDRLIKALPALRGMSPEPSFLVGTPFIRPYGGRATSTP